ncbi:MAG TPA: hypothetical protein VFQ38_12205 [Longimicrobiales bacterium]|nr:hypothetical protein [Longimicrobiales bacterium]
MDTSLLVHDDVVEVVASGMAEFDQCADLVARLAAELRVRPGFAGLLDVRGLDYLPNVREARALADLLVSHRPAFAGRVAIVTQPGAHFGMGRLQTIVASLHGVPVEAFTMPGQAISWLKTGAA